MARESQKQPGPKTPSDVLQALKNVDDLDAQKQILSALKSIRYVESLELQAHDFEDAWPVLMERPSFVWEALLKRSTREAIVFAAAKMMQHPPGPYEDVFIEQLASAGDVEMLRAFLERVPQSTPTSVARLSKPLQEQVLGGWAFEFLLEGGREATCAWDMLKHQGLQLLRYKEASSSKSLVWLTRFSQQLQKQTPNDDRLFDDALSQSDPRESHRLLCAMMCESQVHDALFEHTKSTHLAAFKSALFDLFQSEADPADYAEHHDRYFAILKKLQTHEGKRALAPVKDMLVKQSAAAQRYRDSARLKEISSLLKPLLLTGQKHKKPYAQKAFSFSEIVGAQKTGRA